MQSNSILKLPLMATSALLVCYSLFAVSPAMALSCRDATLQGAYGYQAQGALSPAPNIALSFRSVWTCFKARISFITRINGSVSLDVDWF